MFFVLERDDKFGCFFPKGGDPTSYDFVGDLQQAEYFKTELKDGKIICTPALPVLNCWHMRHVELRLV